MLRELLEEVLAINNSLEEARSYVEETELDKPYLAVISINMSSGCEEIVQARAIDLAIFSHTVIDYIDEVSAQ